MALDNLLPGSSNRPALTARRDVTPCLPCRNPRLGSQVSTRIVGRRTAIFTLTVFMTASRMALPKILVLMLSLAYAGAGVVP